jgi:bacterioferritin-associated ferredoxin
MIRIDRCVCFARTFDELAEVARETGASTLSQLQDHIEFGQNCRLCHPYIRRMLRTGQTVFHQIIEESEEQE